MPSLARDVPRLVVFGIGEWWSKLDRKNKKLALFVFLLSIGLAFALWNRQYYEACLVGFFLIVTSFILWERQISGLLIGAALIVYNIFKPDKHNYR
jgi:hypothetical protein